MTARLSTPTVSKRLPQQCGKVNDPVMTMCNFDMNGGASN